MSMVKGQAIKSQSRTNINSAGLSRGFYSNSPHNHSGVSIMSIGQLQQAAQQPVLISGQSVKPVNHVAVNKSVNISSDAATASSTKYVSHSVTTIPPPSIPQTTSHGTFFLTEVNHSSGAGNAEPTVTFSAQQPTTPVQNTNAIATQTSKAATPVSNTKIEPRYMSVTRNMDIQNLNRLMNTMSDLPPVQNLTSIAIRNKMHDRMAIIKTQQKQTNDLLATGGIGAAAYHARENQYDSKNKQKQPFPLRQSLNPNLNALSKILNSNDFSTRFSHHAPMSEPGTAPAYDNDDAISVRDSVYSGESRASRRSTGSRSSSKTDRSERSDLRSEKSDRTDNLPPISSPKSVASVAQSTQSAPSVRSSGSHRSHRSSNSERSHKRHKSPSAKSHREETSAEVEDNFDNIDAVSVQSRRSVRSGHSEMSGMSAASKRSRRSEYFSIGSDAESDRIIQLEENLRAEEEARIHVQQALTDVQQRQYELLKRLDPDQREKFMKETGIALPASSTKSNRSEPHIIDMDGYSRSSTRQRHVVPSSYRSIQESGVSSPQVDVSDRLKRSEDEIRELQDIINNLAHNLVHRDLTSDKNIKRMLSEVAQKKPYLTNYDNSAFDSVKDVNTDSRKNGATYRTQFYKDHRGNIILS
jgi:hypothetical protein